MNMSLNFVFSHDKGLGTFPKIRTCGPSTQENKHSQHSLART